VQSQVGYFKYLFLVFRIVHTRNPAFADFGGFIRIPFGFVDKLKRIPSDPDHVIVPEFMAGYFFAIDKGTVGALQIFDIKFRCTAGRWIIFCPDDSMFSADRSRPIRSTGLSNLNLLIATPSCI
jgi:hypothetical protein